GRAVEQPQVPPPAAETLIGYAWLYGIHARSSIARAKLWQAEYMVSAMRDHVLALAGLRRGGPAREGRGMDPLPPEITSRLEAALIPRIDAAQIRGALHVVTAALQVETAAVDPDLARRLEAALAEIGDPEASAWSRST